MSIGIPKFKCKVHHKGVLSLYNKGAHPTKRSSYMNDKHVDEKKKAQIDILYGLKYSMREIGRKLSISHSTVSRYLKKPTRKKKDFNIHIKYKDFIEYLRKYYD